MQVLPHSTYRYQSPLRKTVSQPQSARFCAWGFCSGQILTVRRVQLQAEPIFQFTIALLDWVLSLHNLYIIVEKKRIHTLPKDILCEIKCNNSGGILPRFMDRTFNTGKRYSIHMSLHLRSIHCEYTRSHSMYIIINLNLLEKNN